MSNNSFKILQKFIRQNTTYYTHHPDNYAVLQFSLQEHLNKALLYVNYVVREYTVYLFTGIKILQYHLILFFYNKLYIYSCTLQKKFLCLLITYKRLFIKTQCSLKIYV